MLFPRPLSSLLCVVALASCKDETPRSTTPSISFVSMDPRTVKAASSEDTVFLTFRFSDGDADLGVGANTSTPQYDVFLTDNRDNKVSQYLFPEIADELRDPAKGMTGTATIILQAALLRPRDSLHTVLGDTLKYEVYVKDRAGHESNRFTTPEIFLTPP
jgi:hypothetical protein